MPVGYVRHTFFTAMNPLKLSLRYGLKLPYALIFRIVTVIYILIQICISAEAPNLKLNNVVSVHYAFIGKHSNATLVF